VFSTSEEVSDDDDDEDGDADERGWAWIKHVNLNSQVEDSCM